MFKIAGDIQLIEFNFMWIVITIVIVVVLYFIHNGFSLRLFLKKDEHISDKFFEKFPLVTPEFINKNAKEQLIENNQEIHELNKTLLELKEEIKNIKEEIEQCKRNS